MPVSAGQANVLRQYIGQGEIFNLVTAPTNPNPLTLNVVGGSMIGVMPAGTGGGGNANSLGLTSGPAEFTYKPTFKGVSIEQATSETAPRVDGETVTLKFKCAEATYNRIKAAIQTATLLNPVSGGAVTALAYKHFMFVGGTIFFNTDCWALVSKSVDSSNNVLYEWICLYAALSVDGVKIDWKRGDTRMFDVTITGYADVTRPEGDQLLQLGQENMSSVNSL